MVQHSVGSYILSFTVSNFLLSGHTISPFNNRPFYITANKWILWSNEKDSNIKNFKHPGIKSIQPTDIGYHIPFVINDTKNRNQKYLNLMIDSFFNKDI